MMSTAFLGPLGPLAVELVLAIGLLGVLLADVLMPAGEKRGLGWGALAVLLAALGSSWLFALQGPALGGAYVGDAYGLLFKRIFLASAALCVLSSIPQLGRTTPRRQGEHHELLLLSVLGMSLLAGTRDVLLLAVCFELMGIPLYVLAAWRRDHSASVEGAIKLFLVGAVSSVTMLYGLSLLFGLAGTSSLPGIAHAIAAAPTPLAWLGAMLTLAGMGFKLGVFPFHMWVPDTYQGSQTPFVAFLSVAPKAAGVVALVQVLYAGDRVLLGLTLLILIALSVATMVAGNLLALRQSNIKRLLAYSGVAHMGLVLMALATGTAEGLATLMFYLIGYLVTNIGAFLVVHAMAEAGGDDSVASFDGLIRRSGWLTLAMMVFLLSLAGIPFVVGFWAKLFVFVAAWMAGLGWLAVLGAMLSVVGLFYYLRVARAMLMNPPAQAEPIEVSWQVNLGIALCLAGVVLFGLMPGPVLGVARSAAVVFMAAL